MRSFISDALTFSLFFCLFTESLAQAGEREVEGGCDSSLYRDAWYLKIRECGPKSGQGGQASLLANVSKPPVEGGQYAFLLNVGVAEVKGTQVSGGVNYANHARNQIAYNLNLARKVDGFQLGHVNVADSVRGSQIGVLNVARKVDGLSLAFLTLVGNGLFHLDAATEETGMGSLRFASGKGLFTSYSFGFTPAEAAHPFALGMGFGYHHAFDKSYLEAEILGHVVADRHTDFEEAEDAEDGPGVGDPDWRHNTLFQAKLRAGLPLFGKVGVFGGLTYNILDTHGNDRLMAPWSDEATHDSDDLHAWPGVEIGIRLGR